jgi:branched-chain amino acid transport system permease protein
MAAVRIARTAVTWGWPFAVALLGPLLLDSAWLDVGLATAFFGVAAVGFSLMLQLGGMLSLAQGAFLGVGMYAVAKSPWDGLGSLLYAGLWGLAAALVVSALVLRLREIYFALGTIAVALVLEGLARGIPDLGGPSGLIVAASAPLGLSTPEDYFVAGWLLVGVAVLGAHCLRRSRFGLGGRAVAHDTQLAESVGISPRRIRLTVFLLASVSASIAGGVYGHYLMSVAPPVLGVHLGIELAVGSALAGAQPGGSVLGMAVIEALPRFGVEDAGLYLIVLGSVLVGLILFMPRGVRLGSLPGLRGLGRQAAVRRPRPSGPAGAPGDPEPGGTDGATIDVPMTVSSGRTVLEARDVGVAFGGLRAVDGVSLTVSSGEVLGIMGPNGAGKSTLFNLLAGAVPAGAGSVHLNGADVTGWSVARRTHAGLSRTFQIPRVLEDLSVLETAMLGAYRRGRTGALAGLVGADRAERGRLTAHAWEALDRVGLDSVADQPAHLLGTGRRKLLEVARCLAAGPDVLLLDEPAAGLEQGEVDDLARLVKRLADGGLAIILIEHGIDFLMDASHRVGVMEAGRLIAIGAPSDVREDPEVLRAYLG